MQSTPLIFAIQNQSISGNKLQLIDLIYSMFFNICFGSSKRKPITGLQRPDVLIILIPRSSEIGNHKASCPKAPVPVKTLSSKANSNWKGFLANPSFLFRNGVLKSKTNLFPSCDNFKSKVLLFPINCIISYFNLGVNCSGFIIGLLCPQDPVKFFEMYGSSLSNVGLILKITTSR